MIRCLVGLFCICLTSFGSATAQSTLSYAEYQVKAVFLYNFSKFTNWSPSNDPFVICIIGRDDFHGALERVVEGRDLAGRPYQVERSDDLSKISGCDILFISESENSRIEEITAEATRQGVLTVGETPGFELRGGIINLVHVGENIRMRINLTTAQNANIEFRSSLLKLAQIVEPPGNDLPSN
jgi:hypothetical protein